MIALSDFPHITISTFHHGAQSIAQEAEEEIARAR